MLLTNFQNHIWKTSESHHLTSSETNIPFTTLCTNHCISLSNAIDGQSTLNNVMVVNSFLCGKRGTAFKHECILKNIPFLGNCKFGR